jgi:hypothetical protein
MDTTPGTVKILVIDSGKTPIVFERYEFSSLEGLKIKETVLAALNRMGKAAHALIHFNGKFWTADHTAQGNRVSETYYRHEVQYHPFMKELT